MDREDVVCLYESLVPYPVEFARLPSPERIFVRVHAPWGKRDFNHVLDDMRPEHVEANVERLRVMEQVNELFHNAP